MVIKESSHAGAACPLILILDIPFIRGFPSRDNTAANIM